MVVILGFTATFYFGSSENFSCISAIAAIPEKVVPICCTMATVAWRNGLRARIESVTDYYCNAESLYTEEVTKDRTGN